MKEKKRHLVMPLMYIPGILFLPQTNLEDRCGEKSEFHIKQKS